MANNIIFAFLAGFISTVMLHYANAVGYEVPKDMADALPASIALIVAHMYDVITHENK